MKPATTKKPPLPPIMSVAGNSSKPLFNHQDPSLGTSNKKIKSKGGPSISSTRNASQNKVVSQQRTLSVMRMNAKTEVVFKKVLRSKRNLESSAKTKKRSRSSKVGYDVKLDFNLEPSAQKCMPMSIKTIKDHVKKPKHSITFEKASLQRNWSKDKFKEPDKKNKLEEAAEDPTFFEPYFIDMMNQLLARGSEDFKLAYIKAHTNSEKNCAQFEEKSGNTFQTSSKQIIRQSTSKLRPVDFDPFGEYTNVNGPSGIAEILDSFSICPMFLDSYLECSMLTGPFAKGIPGSMDNEAKKSQMAIQISPIEVFTTFSEGKEFRLFKYFYKTNEWRGMPNIRSSQYVHYTKECYVDWSVAKTQLVDFVH